ncbi:MAG: ATP-binding protein [Rhodobacteraceae bacterium]|nr:ATP-binding protein [Paracoccaceae bacterium]
MTEPVCSIEEVIAGFPIPVILVDKSMMIISTNSEATKYFNSPLVGNSLYLLFRQPDVLKCIRESLSESEIKIANISETRNEIEKNLALMFNPVDMSSQDEKVLVISLIDESVRGSAEQMRRDFVANVSHELKTPLTSLSGFIETLKNDSWDDPQARIKFLEIMENEALRMNRLVRDLLSLSKVEVKETTEPSREVNLSDVLDIAKNTMRPLTQKYETRIHISGLNSNFAIRGDKDQLIQVFNNLLENAIKYGPAKGNVELNCELVKENYLSNQDHVKIDIRDYGKGFDPIHIPRLTERFYRIDKHRSREVGGTGLGLAIVKHILNRHWGRLEISSDIGKGSVFSVILPLLSQN